jgi:uncharacterized tellurite resistance protein B-like protein
MNLRSMAIDERMAFLHLARHAIAADGVITRDEEEWVEDCRRAAGLIGRERLDNLPWQDAAGRIQRLQSRRITFLALCGLLYADQHLDDAEVAWIDALRQLWGLDEAFAEACLNLTARQAALRREAETLVMD